MVIKMKEMQIKERDHRHISSWDDKGDLKASKQQTLKHYLYEYLSQSDMTPVS